MSAIAFTDPANFAGVRFPDVSRQEADQFYFEPEICSAHSFEGIIGKSSGIRRVLEQVAIVAPTDSTVLLHGETGTGKELIARAIHNLSSRRDRAYVRMNCAAIPPPPSPGPHDRVRQHVTETPRRNRRAAGAAQNCADSLLRVARCRVSHPRRRPYGAQRRDANRR